MYLFSSPAGTDESVASLTGKLDRLCSMVDEWFPGYSASRSEGFQGHSQFEEVELETCSLADNMFFVVATGLNTS